MNYPTIETTQLIEAISHIEDLKSKCRSGMIIGNTGAGKTFVSTMLKSKYTKQKKDDVYMMTVSSTYTWDDVVDDLMVLFDVHVTIANRVAQKQKKLNAIVEKIKQLVQLGKKPIIIIDEAENLPVAMLKSIKTLYDALLRICPIVLIGTDQLVVNILNKKQKNRQAIPQLWRRLKMGMIELSPINRGLEFGKFFDALKITDAELQNMCLKYCDNYGELTDFLYPLIEESNGKPTAKLAKLYFKLK